VPKLTVDEAIKQLEELDASMTAAQKAERVMDVFRQVGVESKHCTETLDECVHDVASNAASAVNNHGTAAQLEYIAPWYDIGEFIELAKTIVSRVEKPDGKAD